MSRYCSKCGKPNKACICPWIQSLSSNVELIILQHPHEMDKPLGTARILSLSLANSQVLVGEDFSQSDELNALLAEPNVQHYVLFPNDSSQSAAALKTCPHEEKVRVILLDGTWRKAYKMWQLSNNLHELPSLHLPDDLVGNYRIRKAPNENSLSTVEAGYHILSVLESQSDFTPLLTAFEHMVEFQISHMPKGVYERNYGQGKNR